jgi:EAL domain-containing protein (putative c-di-GMP-specific phosphodiesterase class I)
LQQAPSRDRASTAGGEPAGARDGSALTVADIDTAIACATVVFQPIVDADSREIVGVEALARGPMGTQFEQPAVFFAAAETFSRINELELAAKRAAFASGVPDSLALFVNVDPAVLADDRCRSELIEAWRASGFAGDVVVELTERALAASPGRLLRAIDSCREVGWRVALDDLGARAESLTALRLVRPDVAKLDLSLVDGRNRSHAASVAVAVATHRERWPLVVVAEGVETAADEDTARDLGATLLQGFRFGRPATLQDVLAAGAPDTARRAGEWFDPSPIRTTRRVATKRHLLEVTRVVEAMASGPESIVLAAIQSSTYYTRRTRSQYAALARCCGMAGVIGGGIPPGVVRGVHHAPLADDDPLIGEWIVVVLAANGGVALAASDIGHRGGDDLDRLFEYHVTREPGEVESIAHRLLAYF